VSGCALEIEQFVLLSSILHQADGGLTGRVSRISYVVSRKTQYYAVHWIWHDLPTVSHKCHRPAAAMPSTEDDPCLLVWAGNTGLAIVSGGTLDIFEPVWCDRVKAHTAETRRCDNHQKDGKPRGVGTGIPHLGSGGGWVL